jgi:hypothetical protein
MPDTVLGFYFLALCSLAVAWTLTYRWIARRLRERHAAKHAVLFGTPERRKNGMDKFFALLGFAFQDQAALRDLRLLLACILLKALAVFFVVVFIAMMFTPFFLHLNDSM